MRKLIDVSKWDETKNAFELAELMDVTPQAIHRHARVYGREYVRLPSRRTGNGGKRQRPKGKSCPPWMLPSESNERREVWELVARFRGGDEKAVKLLAERGITAMRCHSQGTSTLVGISGNSGSPSQQDGSAN